MSMFSAKNDVILLGHLIVLKSEVDFHWLGL